jgi:hypothetical protein
MKIKNFIKTALIALGLVFLAIQLIHPEKNISGLNAQSIDKKFPVNAEVAAVLKTACNDCHSNTTQYPWYSNIQPIAWYLNDHVVDGKKHLNFDEFLSYPLDRQYEKLEEIDEMIVEDEMPLTSYTIIHTNAKMTEAQKEMLIQWSKNMRDSMETWYSANSLISHKEEND